MYDQYKRNAIDNNGNQKMRFANTMSIYRYDCDEGYRQPDNERMKTTGGNQSLKCDKYKYDCVWTMITVEHTS